MLETHWFPFSAAKLDGLGSGSNQGHACVAASVKGSLMRLSSAAVPITAAIAFGLAGCGKPAKPPPQPTAQVDVVTIHAAPVAITTELPGRLTAHRVAQIRPQVSGVILKRLFTEGEMVRAGQPLYQIDPRPYQASLASARATTAKARASVVSAQMMVKRYRPLAKAFAVSGQDLDNAVASLAQDEADVASGVASEQTAEINLTYTRMDSPIAGRAGPSNVTEGALVTQNQTDTLVTVTELDPIYVDVTENSATVLRLKREYAAGHLEHAGANAAAVSLVLDDGMAYAQRGRLLFSDVTVDASTGSVILRALFPNPDGLLLPNMFVREEIQEGIRQNGLLVPQRAVTHDERGTPTAYVVDPTGHAELRDLVTERTVGTSWLVTKGVADGDRVIVSGLQQVKPGAPVIADEVTMDGAELRPVKPK
jgi:membrane fusion protein (multidrug efflux system)